MCDPNINQLCSSLTYGPWGLYDGSKFAIKMCTCKSKSCPPPASIYYVSPPPPCPPPCVPLPPVCGIYEQAIPKPRLPCPPPYLPRYLELGYPSIPPCPPPCPTKKISRPVCLPNSYICE